MESRLVLLTFVALLFIGQASSLFFGTPVCRKLTIQKYNLMILLFQNSQCNSDSQCPTFQRTRCLGNSFIFCFGKSESYAVSGRCLNRSNIFCDVGSKQICDWKLRIHNDFSKDLLNGGRRNRNCRYRQCARCLVNSDCPSFNQVCHQQQFYFDRCRPHFSVLL